MTSRNILSLIYAAQKGDKKSFEILVLKFQSSVFQWAFHLLGNEEDAKDVVQETFIKSYLSLDSYNVKYSFATWLHKIMRNQCYDKLRLMKHYEILTQPDNLDIIVPETDILQPIIDKELKSNISHLTKHLTT
jgi:RNA polymerase sigma-70 factor (ECF subfamily)